MPWSPARLLFVVALVLSAPVAQAVTVEDLHRATVEVEDKGGEARSEAFREGLERVLVKMAGSAALLEREGVRQLLKNPAGLVQQYRYEPIEREADSGGDADGDSDTDTGPRYRLTVTYAGARIEERLEALDVVVWGEERPEVLVWLAVDDGRERRVLGADGASDAHAALARETQRRALPYLLPLMDTEDRSKVGFVDISGGFFDAIESASERYRGDILLVGHLRRGGGSWRADWTLLGAGERRAWSGGGGGVAAAVASGVDGATERLAAVLAGQGGERTALRARIIGVDGLADYARVTGYLDGLVRVRSHALREVRPDALLFDLEVRGRQDAFERAVALGDTLVKVEPGMSGERAGEADGDLSEPAGAADSGGGEADTQSEADAGDAAASATGEAAATESSGETETGATTAGDDESARPELVFRLAD